jgi:hypothetical protein
MTEFCAYDLHPLLKLHTSVCIHYEYLFKSLVSIALEIVYWNVIENTCMAQS